jgi:hypothetical protein
MEILNATKTNNTRLHAGTKKLPSMARKISTGKKDTLVICSDRSEKS